MNGRLVVRLVTVGLVIGWMGVACLGQQTAGERPLLVPRPGGVGRPDQIPLRVQRISELEASIAQLKAEHKALADELQAIADLAVQEKAKKATERIKRLIETKQKEFETGLADLERKLNGLKRTLSDAEKKVKRENRVGTPAPMFGLKDPAGKTVSLSDYKGKIVVMEWANPDCPFWRYHAERKTMANLAAQYKDKAVVWLAINSTAGATTDANKKVVDRYKLPYPILEDSSGRSARDYGVTHTPQIFVIGAKGTIVYSGAIDNSPMGKVLGQVINYVDKALSEVLEGKPVTTAQTDPYGSPVRFSGPSQR